MRKKLILFALMAAPLMAQNYGSYNNAPVARPEFLHTPSAVKGNIFGDSLLLGWWPLTEATGSVARDMSGNGYDGTWSRTKLGTNGYWSTGKTGPWSGTFSSAGVSSLSLGSKSVYALQTFSLSLFVNMTSAANPGIIFGGGASANGSSTCSTYAGWYLTKNSFSYCASNAGSMTSVSFTQPSSNVWHHFGISFTSTGSVYVYIDGAQVATATVSAITYQSSAPTYDIGGQAPGGSNGINGFINDVRVYNRVLQQAEFQAIYNAENH